MVVVSEHFSEVPTGVFYCEAEAERHCCQSWEPWNQNIEPEGRGFAAKGKFAVFGGGSV